MQLNFGSVMLQAAPGQGGSMMPLFLMVGMFVVMYFFMIRPQAKRAKEQKKFADSMVENEQIVTTAGIHAKINRANADGTIRVEIAPNTYMTIERSAVSMEMTNAARKKSGTTSVATAK